MSMELLLGVLSSAPEFETIQIRQNEHHVLKTIYTELKDKFSNPNFKETSTKVNILLQSHLSRRKIPSDLLYD